MMGWVGSDVVRRWGGGWRGKVGFDVVRRWGRG